MKFHANPDQFLSSHIIKCGNFYYQAEILFPFFLITHLLNPFPLYFLLKLIKLYPRFTFFKFIFDLKIYSN